MMKLTIRINKDLEYFKEQDAYRFLKPQSLVEGSVIDLSTNDYLGIAQDKSLINDFYNKHKNVSLTASSSRLLSGNHKYYEEVEDKLAELYSSESALFFNSGYHLNIGVLPSLTTKNDLILADKLVHASLIEAFKLSPAKVIRYRHLDYGQLENLLEKNKTNYDNIFIVSESVFSMDGDKVNLKTLVDLKKKYGAYIYLDEAHSVGVCGEKGLGLAEEEGVIPDVDFIVGTMGKALASVGAYLISSSDVKSYLINKCKALIYTTALPPINVAWSSYIISQLPKFTEERKELKLIINYFRRISAEKGVEVEGKTHILAIVVGINRKCLQLAQLLEENHIKVQAVRPPTVPEGTARIRISLHKNLSFKDIDKLINVIAEWINNEK